MVTSFAPVLIIALCTACQAQQFRSGKIIGVSEGRTCEPLQNPKHGDYVCQSKNGRDRCKLLCHAGYVVPITYTPLDVLMDVNLRGIYVCKEVPGGVTWVPSLLFDCVELRKPTSLMLHYGVDFQDPCTSTTNLDNIRSGLLPKLRANPILSTAQRYKMTFSVDIFLECVGKVVGDIELSVPFTEDNADNFPDFRISLDKEMTTNVAHGALKLSGQSKVNKSGFFTDCPRGTRLESDMTCRGCSKGYFLDLSRAECAPCPAGTYQDEALRASCKTCPGSASKLRDGLMDRKQCYHLGIFRKHTSIKTLTWALSCIVIVGSVIIYFRGTVTKEITPETAEKELLELEDEDEDDDIVLDEEADLTKAAGGLRLKLQSFLPAHTGLFTLRGKLGGRGKGSGDFDHLTTRPAKKVDEEIEDKKRILAIARLPLEPKPKTAEARKSLARERMRMTMLADTAKRSAQLRQSQTARSSAILRRKESVLREEDADQHDYDQPTLRQREVRSRSRDEQRFRQDEAVSFQGRRRDEDRFSDATSVFGNTTYARQSVQATGGMGNVGRSSSMESMTQSMMDRRYPY